MDEPKPMTELTRIRQERNLSQQGLADAARVNKATINQIERGRRSPNVETLEKLAAALGVEVADFFPKAQGALPLEVSSRAPGIEVDEAFFVPLKEGEKPDIVTLKPQYVWLFEGGEQILTAMRKASPEEVAEMRRQLEKTGRSRE